MGKGLIEIAFICRQFGEHHAPFQQRKHDSRNGVGTEIAPEFSVADPVFQDIGQNLFGVGQSIDGKSLELFMRVI